MLVITLLGASPAFGDLTVHSKVSFKGGAGVPAQLTQALTTAMKAASAETVTQIHGEMSRTETLGRVKLIDFGRNQITILDTAGQRFATASVDEYTDTLSAASPPMPPRAAQALRTVKVDVEKDKHSFRFATILGIRVQETAIEVTLERPVPQGPAVEIRMEVRFWRPLAEEMDRLPQLKEYVTWAAGAKRFSNSSPMLARMAAFPFFGSQMSSAIETLEKTGDGPAIRVQLFIGSSALAKLTDQPGGHGEAEAGSDLDGSILEMSSEWTDLSTEPLADTVFAVPANFRPIPMRDMVRPPLTPPPAGVKPPVLISRPNIDFSEEARKAMTEGTIVLRVVIGTDGVPRDLRVVKSLTPDLDQKAIESVSQWRFRPAEKDGKQVEATSNIEVNIHRKEH
jgi:TonB family protein